MNFFFNELVPAEQIVEISAAQRTQFERLYGTDWFKSRMPAVQALMRQYPFWDFYQCKEHKLPIRIWGVIESACACELRFRACTNHLGWVCEVLDGLKVDDIERVEKWSAEHIHLIETLPPTLRHAFLDPMGFATFPPPDAE